MFPSIKTIPQLPPPPPKNEKEQIKSVQLTTNKHSFPSITKAIKNKPSSSYTSIQYINKLLPYIQNNMKESKSIVTKDIITNMFINNKLLLYELAAIRIQTLIRIFLSKLYCSRIKKRIELFCNITEYCSNRYIEEYILSTCIEISFEFYRQHQRYQICKNSVEKEIIQATEYIMNEVLLELVVDIAKTTIQDAIDVVITLRKSANLAMETIKPTLSIEASTIKPTNPLLGLLEAIVEENTGSCLRSIVYECIEEEVKEYFTQQHSAAIYTSLLYELILETLIDVTQIYFAEPENNSSGSNNIIHKLTLLLQEAKLQTGLNYDIIPSVSTSTTDNTKNTTMILTKLTRRATTFREYIPSPLKTPTANTDNVNSPKLSFS